MKYEVVPNSCRICLRRTTKLRSIYKPLEEGEEPPREMLRLITGITLEEADVHLALPKSICKNCELSLSLAFQFRVKTLRSQRIIELYCKQLQETEQKLTDERGTTTVKQELDDSMDFHECMAEDYINEDELDSTKHMKVEMLEVSFSDVEANEQDVLDTYEYDSDCKAEYLEEAELCDAYNMPPNEMMSTEADNDEKVDIRQFNYHDYDTNNDTEVHISPAEILQIKTNIVTKSRASSRQTLRYAARGRLSKQEPRFNSTSGTTKRTSENPRNCDAVTARNTRKEESDCGHICDICGNIYAKRGRMMEHRRRHDKELRFACELCDKRFHLREKLRKHMFSHKGGKPYKCSHCSRTFFYESVKKAHEAVHSGIKPYVCEECNKAFAYAHALSKHKLIHADIKLYHCEYCDKDFRLQHHMKQHVETKLHQNAVRAAEEAKRTGKAALTIRKSLVVHASLKPNGPLI